MVPALLKKVIVPPKTETKKRETCALFKPKKQLKEKK